MEEEGAPAGDDDHIDQAVVAEQPAKEHADQAASKPANGKKKGAASENTIYDIDDSGHFLNPKTGIKFSRNNDAQLMLKFTGVTDAAHHMLEAVSRGFDCEFACVLIYKDTKGELWEAQKWASAGVKDGNDGPVSTIIDALGASMIAKKGSDTAVLVTEKVSPRSATTCTNSNSRSSRIAILRCSLVWWLACYALDILGVVRSAQALKKARKLREAERERMRAAVATASAAADGEEARDQPIPAEGERGAADGAGGGAQPHGAGAPKSQQEEEKHNAVPVNIYDNCLKPLFWPEEKKDQKDFENALALSETRKVSHAKTARLFLLSRRVISVQAEYTPSFLQTCKDKLKELKDKGQLSLGVSMCRCFDPLPGILDDTASVPGAPPGPEAAPSEGGASAGPPPTTLAGIVVPNRRDYLHWPPGMPCQKPRKIDTEGLANTFVKHYCDELGIDKKRARYATIKVVAASEVRSHCLRRLHALRSLWLNESNVCVAFLTHFARTRSRRGATCAPRRCGGAR